MQRYLVVGSERRKGTASLVEEVDRQSMSVAFARQLYKAATGLTADTQTCVEFRDKLFRGPKRVFDFVDISDDGKRLGRSTLAVLRKGIERSDRIILLGKDVAKRISRYDVPPERRIEIGVRGRDEDEEQAGASELLLAAVDPAVWEVIVRLALELAA